MRGLFGWATVRGLVPVAPTLNAKLLTGANDEVGFFGWTDDELARFEAKWPVGTRQRLAFDLSLHTGFRRSDAVKIGRQHVRGREPSKTGDVVPRPILRNAGRVDRSDADRRSHLHHQRAGPGPSRKNRTGTDSTRSFVMPASGVNARSTELRRAVLPKLELRWPSAMLSMGGRPEAGKARSTHAPPKKSG